MKSSSWLLVVALVGSQGAWAQPPEGFSRAEEPAWQRWGDFVHRPAFEANLVGPFLGLSDFRVMVPALRADRRDWRGEWVLGVSTDYSFGPISRPVDQYGKVLLLTLRLGYRQFLLYGFHIEVTANLGWRHEANNLHDGARSLDGAYGRLWILAGYQLDLTPRVYANLRGGVGLYLFRTDRFGSFEKRVIPSGELNLGLRF